MRVRGLGILLLIAVASAPVAARPRSERPRHVLLLHSYEREFSPFDHIAEVFQKELSQQSTQQISFFDVSLQPARSSQNPEDGPTVEYMRSTFAGQRLDLIVAVGAPAARFAARHGADLFPETPILLAGVDEKAVGQDALPPNATAVTVANDPV